ncbi:flagellar basal body rod protein FlgB [Legionella sp. CNM-4043-24]|uniref:flagellar basal body rod protein FlgB n=1 Tax=Legionella sp. CNM-4043-24 TaxID=3421646 RepID=UPI00403B290F
MIGSVFGLEQRALKLCEDRAALLAGNIANSSTPNYKSRDFDFQDAMKEVSVGALQTTDARHLNNLNTANGHKLLYRVPMQLSTDENTVDDELERKNFIQNAINYQAGLTFAQNTMGNLMQAIRGE